MNKNRALILAVTSCFIVAACAEKAEAPKPKAAAVAAIPKPPEAPAAAPASAGQDAKTAGAPVMLADATQAGKGGGRKGKRCKKNDSACDVVVTIGANCAFTLTDNGDIDVEKGRNDDKIEWKLDTAGYSWKGKGVTWKDSNASGPKGQFYDNDVKGKVASWKDRNTDDVEYKYTLEVEDKDKKPCKYDPTVINGVNP